jgi:hypothetical protein
MTHHPDLKTLREIARSAAGHQSSQLTPRRGAASGTARRVRSKEPKDTPVQQSIWGTIASVALCLGQWLIALMLGLALLAAAGAR